MTLTEVSVVVGYYNEHHKILTFLQSIDEFPPGNDYEVIVVTDKEHGKELPWTPKNVKQIFTERQSFSEAYNDGLAVAKGEYVVLSNCDVVFNDPPYDWFARCKKLLTEEVVCVVPKINVPQKKEPPVVVDCVLPCFFWVLKNPGTPFFDERYTAGSHCEDSDVCEDWLSQGKRFVVVSDFTITHFGNGPLTTKPDFEGRKKINQELYCTKWGHKPSNYWLWRLNGDKKW